MRAWPAALTQAVPMQELSIVSSQTSQHRFMAEVQGQMIHVTA